MKWKFFAWIFTQNAVSFPHFNVHKFYKTQSSGTGSTQPREDNWGATWKESSAPVYKTEINGRGDSLRWPRDTLYRLKLALTSPTSGGRSVGIVRWQTKAPVFFQSHSHWKSRGIWSDGAAFNDGGMSSHETPLKADVFCCRRWWTWLTCSWPRFPSRWALRSFCAAISTSVRHPGMSLWNSLAQGPPRLFRWRTVGRGL
jgi:hypothetical protein